MHRPTKYGLNWPHQYKNFKFFTIIIKPIYFGLNFVINACSNKFCILSRIGESFVRVIPVCKRLVILFTAHLKNNPLSTKQRTLLHIRRTWDFEACFGFISYWGETGLRTDARKKNDCTRHAFCIYLMASCITFLRQNKWMEITSLHISSGPVKFFLYARWLRASVWIFLSSRTCIIIFIYIYIRGA